MRPRRCCTCWCFWRRSRSLGARLREGHRFPAEDAPSPAPRGFVACAPSGGTAPVQPSRENFLSTPTDPPQRDALARLRFSIIGLLLAAPPEPGEVHGALATLAARTWRHPLTGLDRSEER